MDQDKIIFSLDVTDAQVVAEREFDLRLTDDDLKIIEDNLEDYIHWYDAIILAIQSTLKREK